MAIVDLVMPKLGESIMEATVLKWHKQPGDSVQQDETVLEIATDKVDSEVPSITDGIIDTILFRENDVVPIGAVIATIRTEDSASFKPLPTNETFTEAVVDVPLTPEPEPSNKSPLMRSESSRFYSPLVMNIASSEGVSMPELETILGTGNEGRVTKKDIIAFVENKNDQGRKESEPAEPLQAVKPVTAAEAAIKPARSGNVELIEMDRMGKLISEHMTRSVQTSAHVTSFAEADVTNMVLWRNKVKFVFEKREGTKITFTPLFVEAIARCLKKFPLLNSSVEGTNILLRKDINIGMATALENGNLIVPVIKNADLLNLTGLARQVNDLADKARNNKLRPEDTQGGTFTFTNVGTFGSLAGTPIINQPQVAILAVGAIKKRPVVIETPSGDSIGIRHMMYLSMSYDHRIINGSVGASFLTAVAKELENFDAGREP